MRAIVCGGRKYRDSARVGVVLMALASDVIIVTGGAGGTDDEGHYGADHLAELHGVWQGKQVETHYPLWQKHGAMAGPIRNQEMLDSGVDLVIAFPGGSGTADMVRRAKGAGVIVLEVE